MSKIAVNEITDEVGTGAPAFPNGMSVTGAALTDPEITGGIYLGGTGSANYLDDYEEGTWTPTVATGSVVFRFANYVKVGKQVTAYCLLENFTDISTGANILISGLPFASASTQRSCGALMGKFITAPSGLEGYASFVGSSVSSIALYGVYTGNFNEVQHSDLNNANAEIYITITYLV